MQTDISSFMNNLSVTLDDFNEEAARADANFEDFANWDSLAALSVIVMINMEYEVEVSGTELKQCSTPNQLFEMIRSKKN